MSEVDGVGLAEVLEHLRNDLSVAQDEGTGERLRFQVTEAEVELLTQFVPSTYQRVPPA